MAWNKVNIEIGGKEYSVQESATSTNPFFSIPAFVEISEGDTFSIGKKQFAVLKVVDLANRGETLLVEAKESKANDKRAKGRSDSQDGGSGNIGEDDA